MEIMTCRFCKSLMTKIIYGMPTEEDQVKTIARTYVPAASSKVEWWTEVFSVRGFDSRSPRN